MDVVLAFVVGGLYAGAIYMMLRRSIVKVVIGLSLLTYGSSLLIFTVGGVSRGGPPIIAPGAVAPTEPFADPLPQALILTAIVIGFGVQAFTLVLFKRTYQTSQTDDLDEIRTAETGELLRPSDRPE